MTKYDHKNTLLERGGLMIEALAMLGLIAVVTPTMYKKSAERTLEVEDINTATTMRSYMNAAEAWKVIGTAMSLAVSLMMLLMLFLKTMPKNQELL